MATTTSPQLDSSNSSGRGFMLLIIALLVVMLAAVAYFVTSRERVPSGDPQAPITIEGDAIPAFPLPSGVSANPEEDPGIGMPFPSFEGTDFAGNPVVIENDGRPKAIFFLAHWCPHCQRELPKVVDLTEAGLVPEGVDIYAVNTDYDPSAGNPPSRWFHTEDWPHPVVRDDESSSAFVAAGGRGFPYAVYLDAENNVVARSSGEVDDQTLIGLWTGIAATG